MTVRIMVGDALSQLAKLPDESVHCVVTSPPYWGLRAYKGDPGMIGLEPTFDEHLSNLVAVFREVRRVLRSDGTCWVNYGDAYTSGGRATYRSGASENKGHQVQDDMPRPNTPNGLKPKDLMMMPARVAMALQADGWWLRSEICWHKPNPMPESCTDRPTSSHEKLYLLTKAARYSYDAEAVRLPATGRAGPMRFGKPPDRQDNERTYQADGSVGANLRNVWTIDEDEYQQFIQWKAEHTGAMTDAWKVATHSFKEAHFATFPPALVEPCIKAGTSEEGVCGECGAPWAREVTVSKMEIARSERTHELGRTRSSGTMTKPRTSATTGWSPSCDHDAPTVPATVIDPFAGAGTVGLVAERLQRDAILIEISPEYAEMARHRIEDDAGLFGQVVGGGAPDGPPPIPLERKQDADHFAGGGIDRA